MTIKDIYDYIKKLNTNTIFIDIEKYPIINTNTIYITVIDGETGVRGIFITNLNICNLSISESAFTTFREICQKSIECVKKEANKYIFYRDTN